MAIFFCLFKKLNIFVETTFHKIDKNKIKSTNIFQGINSNVISDHSLGNITDLFCRNFKEF